MPLYRIVLLLLFLSLLVPLPGEARDLCFRITTVEGDRVATGRVYVKGEKYRIEQDGEAEYAILREDLKRSWFIDPRKRSYTESPFDARYRPRIEDKDSTEIDRTYLGTRQVNGRKVLKYLITAWQGQKRGKIYQWTDAASGLPIRIDDANGTWRLYYSEFKKSVPDYLFELPAGYSPAHGWTRPFMRVYSSVWFLCGAFLIAWYILRKAQPHPADR